MQSEKQFNSCLVESFVMHDYKANVQLHCEERQNLMQQGNETSTRQALWNFITINIELAFVTPFLS